MEPHLLRTFSTVARLGSFSAAARELGYTQSAVSQQIAALEADLGVELLSRRPVAVTEAGARLLEHVGPLLLRLAAARADVLRAAGSPAERLAVGASPLAGHRLGRALAETSRMLPRLEITVEIAPLAAVVAGVVDGSFDLGVVVGVAAPSDPLTLPDVSPPRSVGVDAEPAVVALPADHPLADRSGLCLEHLADARWIEAAGVTASLAQLRSACAVDGFRPCLRYQGTDVPTLLSLVEAGVGLALLPVRLLPPSSRASWPSSSPSASGAPTSGLAGGLAGSAPAGMPAAVLADVGLPGGEPGDAALPDAGLAGGVAGGVVGVPVVDPRLEFRTELVSAGRLSTAARLLADLIEGEPRGEEPGLT